MQASRLGRWGALGLLCRSRVRALGNHREKGKTWLGQAIPLARELAHAWSDPSLRLCSPPRHHPSCSTTQIIFQDLL